MPFNEINTLSLFFIVFFFNMLNAKIKRQEQSNVSMLAGYLMGGFGTSRPLQNQ